MTDVVLTVVDTSAIQDYVFAGNRLRESVGASYLVHLATHDWAFEALPREHNVADAASGEVDGRRLERDGLAAELLYAGGGNTIVLFATPDLAREFARKLTRRALDAAPGLDLVVAHSEPFPWAPDGSDLSAQVRDLVDGPLARKKRTHAAASAPLLGLGVTAECASTGLVATRSSRGLEPDGDRLISREVERKLEAAGPATDRLRGFVGRYGDAGRLAGFAFTDELDNLGRAGGEESYVAVVHADGNDMGAIARGFGAGAADNRAYVERMRRFSRGVEDAAGAALVRTLDRLRDRIRRDPERGGWVLEERPPRIAGAESQMATPAKAIRLRKNYWPLRPIVFGGDDVTFLCNGQLGLSLAALYIEAFNGETATRLGTAIHMSAGVCVVKVHYPFRRAYDMSEALTDSAKTWLGTDRAGASAIDWHFSTTGLGLSLAATREREYSVDAGTLLMRPVRVLGADDWRSWSNVSRILGTLNYDPRWSGRRNQLKALREALRDGEEAVASFLRAHALELPRMDDPAPPAAVARGGWDGARCGYFDALEAMDHHLEL